MNPNATREEYLYFSLPEKLIFYVLALMSLFYMGRQVYDRVKLWQTGRPTGPVREGKQYWMPTKEGVLKWWSKVLPMILLQKKVRASRPTSGAPMHLMMFYGFGALFIATTLLGINTYSPYKFHKGAYYLLYEATFDSLGLLLLFGWIWAFCGCCWESLVTAICWKQLALLQIRSLGTLGRGSDMQLLNH